MIVVECEGDEFDLYTSEREIRIGFFSRKMPLEYYLARMQRKIEIWFLFLLTVGW